MGVRDEALRPAEVLDRLRALDQQRLRLTVTQLRHLGEGALLRAAVRQFGSLSAAREAAGVAKPRRADAVTVPRAWILDALRGRAGPIGVLAEADVDRQLATAARLQFGSVQNAIKAAGLAVAQTSSGVRRPPPPGRPKASPTRARGKAAQPAGELSGEITSLLDSLVESVTEVTYRETAGLFWGSRRRKRKRRLPSGARSHGNRRD